MVVEHRGQHHGAGESQDQGVTEALPNGGNTAKAGRPPVLEQRARDVSEGECIDVPARRFVVKV
jgi:hypothetical protein